MRRLGIVVLAAAAVAAAACSSGSPDPSGSAPPSSTPPASASDAPASASASASASVSSSPRTASPTAAALRRGAPSATCVNGWREPAPGTAQRTEPLDLLRATQGFGGSFRVVDLRYFTGPDDANLSPGSRQRTPVERWYGKVVYSADPTFAIRFLAVRRDVGEGVVAVAPYRRSGWSDGGWLGFDGEGGRSRYPDVPGYWPGTPYDYDEAGELPRELTGCVG